MLKKIFQEKKVYNDIYIYIDMHSIQISLSGMSNLSLGTARMHGIPTVQEHVFTVFTYTQPSVVHYGG
jgi:hypothetical protein